MPRKPRIEQVGFHHIINTGVARSNIFLKPRDYEKFLEILLESKLRYDFIVHSFCLMKNHYHLLIETNHENLSLLARQINSKYAQYFNREYSRIGPLWQGRFKNFYVFNEEYLNKLLKYIENNPIKAEVVKKVGEYRWCSTFYLQNSYNKELLDRSILLKKRDFFSLISGDEVERLAEFEKTKYSYDVEKAL